VWHDRLLSGLQQVLSKTSPPVKGEDSYVVVQRANEAGPINGWNESRYRLEGRSSMWSQEYTIITLLVFLLFGPLVRFPPFRWLLWVVWYQFQ